MRSAKLFFSLLCSRSYMYLQFDKTWYHQIAKAKCFIWIDSNIPEFIVFVFNNPLTFSTFRVIYITPKNNGGKHMNFISKEAYSVSIRSTLRAQGWNWQKRMTHTAQTSSPVARGRFGSWTIWTPDTWAWTSDFRSALYTERTPVRWYRKVEVDGGISQACSETIW